MITLIINGSGNEIEQEALQLVKNALLTAYTGNQDTETKYPQLAIFNLESKKSQDAEEVNVEEANIEKMKTDEPAVIEKAITEEEVQTKKIRILGLKYDFIINCTLNINSKTSTLFVDSEVTTIDNGENSKFVNFKYSGLEMSVATATPSDEYVNKQTKITDTTIRQLIVFADSPNSKKFPCIFNVVSSDNNGTYMELGEDLVNIFEST